MNGYIFVCCAFGVLLTACTPRDEDTVPCSDDTEVKLEIGPFGATNPVRTDLDISGTVEKGADTVVYGIALAVSAATGNDEVFDIPATFVPPGSWNAVVPLNKLLAPLHGAGTIKIRARVTTNCGPVMDMQSAPFEVAPPIDAGVDAR